MTGLKTSVLRLTATAAIAACTGCVYDHDACPPQDAADGILGLRIELTVPGTDPATRTGVTRAEEDVHGDGSFSMEEGAQLENMIDVDDYKVVVFDKNGDMAGDVVMKGVTIEGPSGGDHIRYTLSGTLHVSATDARTNLESFRIMVLANWKGFVDTDYEYPDFNEYRIPADEEDAISGEKKNLYKDGTNFNFTMPIGGTDDELVIKSWGPTDGNDAAKKKSYIPMFGISGPIRLKDAQDMGKYSDNPVANISMLRALAKIEIVDMVPDEAGASMERCVLTRSNKYGRFIPDVTDAGNTGWDTPDKQISAPSLPAVYAGNPGSDAFMTGVQFIRSTEPTLVKFDDGTEKPLDRDHYVIYVPEMDLSGLSAERPVVQVEIDGRSYDIQLSTYAEGKAATPYTSLLRNHIYRFNVKSVGISADLGLEIETPEWDLDDDQVWDYEDMKAGFTEKFHWIDPTYEKPTDIDADQQRILLVTTNDGVEGSFKLESPKNTKWILSLIADDGTPNYWFRIDMWDNEKKEWIVADQMPDSDKFIADTQTGDIDGEPVRFRIIPTASNSSEADYSARVVLTLQTFDGRVMNVKLTNNSTVDPDEDEYYYKVKHLTNGGDNM